MKTSPVFTAAAAALLAIQRDIEKIPFVKDATNPDVHSTYITLGTLLNLLKPILTKNECVVTQGGGENITDGLLIAIAIETTLVHAPSGEWISQTIPVPLVGRKRKKEDGGGTHPPDAQAGGGAITYGMRYGLVAFFDIPIDKDNDGAEASLRRRRGVARRITGEPATATETVERPTEWYEAGVMPWGLKRGTLMKELDVPYLRRALADARSKSGFDEAKAIEAHLARRAELAAAGVGESDVGSKAGDGVGGGSASTVPAKGTAGPS